MMETSSFSDDLNLQKYWSVLRRRWLPITITFGLISTLSILSTLFDEPVYRAQGSLLFKSSRAPSLSGLDGNIGELDALSFGGNPLETQAQIVRSVPIARSIIHNLNLKTADGKPMSPQALLGSLDVLVISQTADVLAVSYRSPDPELAASIVNQAMNEYISANLLDNRAEAISAREFIESKLPQAREAVRNAETELRSFKEANQIIALEGEADATVEILKNLDQQILAAQTQLVEITIKSDELSTQLGMEPSESFVVTTLQDAPGVQDLLSQLQVVQKQLTLERTRYRDDYPSVRSLEREEAALTDLLQDRIAQITGGTASIGPERLQTGQFQKGLGQSLANLEVERLALVSQLDQLVNARDAYQTQAQDFPRLEEVQRLLERQLEGALSSYNDLRSRFQEVQIAENQNVGNAQIVQEALVPLKPIASKAKFIGAAGAVCGLLLGIAIAFILDILDRSLKTVEETQRFLRYPLLGLIPDATSQDSSVFPSFNIEILSNGDPYTPIGNAYQTLLSNIKAVSTKDALKVILLTSTTSGEGTSTVAANLAATAAQNHQRVLLIDANLARPSQHGIWKFDNTLGLRELIYHTLEHKPIDWKESVSQLIPNLWIIPAGQIAVSLLRALDSEKMVELIRQIVAAYDLVIFDTPPLTDCADAVGLGRLADEMILVVNPNKANIDDLEAAKDLFSRSNQKLLGFISNQVSVDQEAASRRRMTLWHQTTEKNHLNTPEMNLESS